MANPQKTDEAIVLKVSPSGERFLQADLLCLQSGMIRALYRKTSRPRRLAVDLFDQGEAQVELKPNSHFGFLKDFNVELKRGGIASRYACLEAASYLSNFLIANPIHEINAEATYALCQRALDAFSQGQHPQAILLKTLYVFCRDEGYPVQEEWLRGIDPATRECAIAIINTPVNAIELPSKEQQAALSSFIEYLRRSAYLHIA